MPFEKRLFSTIHCGRIFAPKQVSQERSVAAEEAQELTDWYQLARIAQGHVSSIVGFWKPPRFCQPTTIESEMVAKETPTCRAEPHPAATRPATATVSFGCAQRGRCEDPRRHPNLFQAFPAPGLRQRNQGPIHLKPLIGLNNRHVTCPSRLNPHQVCRDLSRRGNLLVPSSARAAATPYCRSDGWSEEMPEPRDGMRRAAHIPTVRPRCRASLTVP